MSCSSELAIFEVLLICQCCRTECQRWPPLKASHDTAGFSTPPFSAHVTQQKAHELIYQRLLAMQVTVRAQARTIGLRAVRRAAIERQRDTALSKQRKQLTGQLGGVMDLKQASLSVAKSIKVIGEGLADRT